MSLIKKIRIKSFRLNILSAILLLAGFFSCVQGAQAATMTDVYTSAVYDLGGGGLTSIDWTETVSSGHTSIIMQARGGNTVKPDATWNAWINITDNQDISATLGGYEYVQYRATLSNDGTDEPRLEDVTINSTGGFLISSPYNSEDATLDMVSFIWQETLFGSSDVRFQLRTSPDGKTWTPWCGPDDNSAFACNNTTYFTDPAGSETIDTMLTDATNDKYFQYKLVLTADGTNYPVVSDITMSYAIDKTKTRSYVDYYTSEVFNLGGGGLTSFSWNNNIPVGTSFEMQAHGGNTANPLDGTWTPWSDITSGQDLSSTLGGYEYVQYRAILSNDGFNEPTLSDVTLAYSGGYLISSPYNSEDATLGLTSFSWQESLSGSSDVRFQLRTSPDGKTWTPWCGPDNGAAGCSSTIYFTDPNGGEKIDDMLTDATNDKYLQYKLILNSDGANIPTVSEVTLSYSVDSNKTRAYVDYYTSEVYDLGGGGLSALSWNKSVPIGTSLSMQIHAGNIAKPDGTWTPWSDITSGQDLSSTLGGYEYIQYRAILSNDGFNEPVLYDVALAYSGGVLISSPYNSEDSTLKLDSLLWQESLSGSSDVRFQLRTSPDGKNWTPWCGPDNGAAGCSSTIYFTDPNGGEKIDDMLTDATNDKYIQYKVAFTSDGVHIPIISDVTIAYTTNQTKTRAYVDYYTSGAFDLAEGSIASLSWNATIPTGTSLTMQMHSGNTANPLDGTWTPWSDITSGQDLSSSFGGYEFVQYRATLSTDGFAEPSLSEVIISFRGGYLISSPFNSGDATLVMNSISWQESLVGSSDVRFQLRTSADKNIWTPWCGPDNGAAGCSSTTYFTDPNGGEKIDDMLTDGSNDKYIQYKLILTADGTNFPVASEVTIAYTTSQIKSRKYVAIYTSQVIDAGAGVDYATINWNDNIPTGTSLTMRVRAGNVATPDATWIAWSPVNKSGSLDAFDGKQYIQYEATLSTDGFAEPSLYDVTISTLHYLVSSPYDTGDTAVRLSRLTWEENLPAGDSVADVKFQLASSPDGTTWTPWCGPDNGKAGCDGTSFFTNPEGVETIDAELTDGVNDQYIRYKIFLYASSITPIVSSVSVEYAANTPPVVSLASALQGSDGNIDISYSVSDVNQNSFDVSFLADVGVRLNEDLTALDQSALTVTNIDRLPATGTIQIDSEQISYTNKNGDTLTGLTRQANDSRVAIHSNNSVIWVKGVAVSGDVGDGVTIDSENPESLNKAGTWNIRNDLPLYYTEARIRVSANDGTGVLQVGNADSSIFTLDAKAPVVNSVIIDGRKVEDNISFDVSDDTALEMKYSTVEADLDDAGIVYVPYTPAATIVLNAHNVVYFRFKDSKNNFTNYTLSIPQKPQDPLVQDISSIDEGKYQLFISFVPLAAPANGFGGYHVYGADNASGSFALVAEPDQSELNYVLDATLAQNEERFYKLSVSDQAGNYSEYSGVVSDIASGSGGESTLPVITHDSTTQLTVGTSGATIVFTTDANSNSAIQLSTDVGISKEYSNEQGVPTFIPAGSLHTVTLVGLKENTTYYYKIISTDANGNTGELENAETQFFTTTTDSVAPRISNITLTPADTTAIIAFATDEGARVKIDYGTDTNYGLTFLNNNFNLDHHLTLTGLTPATDYHYRITVTDDSVSGNHSESDDLTFATTGTPDLMPPIISAVQIDSVTYNSAAIVFTTDEPASSLIDFGETESLGKTQGNSNDTATAHSVTLAGLSPATRYYFKAKAIDSAGNISSSMTYDFTTEEAPIPATHSPQISNINITNITSSGATIYWMTDIAADSIVGYSINGDYGQEQGSSSLTTSHTVTLSNLSAATTYNLKLKSREEGGELGMAMTNNDQPLTVTTQVGPDMIAPAISFNPEVDITNITANSVTINFATDENANSLVDYSRTEGVFTSTQGKYQDYNTAHSVTLVGLDAATTYYFQLHSRDEAGNEGMDNNNAAGYVFTTLSGLDAVPPSISAVAVSDIQTTSATVTWNTDENSSSLVDFGTSVSFGKTQGDSAESATVHSVTLVGLTPATAYYFRIKSTDTAGNQAMDDNTGTPYTFTTLAVLDNSDTVAPVITFDENTGISNLTSTGITIAWTTDEDSSSTVGYGVDAGFSQEHGSSVLTSNHTVTLVNLSPSTEYRFRLKSQDASGNIAIADNNNQGFSFMTLGGVDTTPPVISSVKTGNLTGSGATITWATDENASSFVEYGTGPDNLIFTAGNLSAAVTSHSVTLGGLSPLTIYYFRVRSEDSSANMSTDNGGDAHYTFTTLATEDVCPVCSGGGGNSRDVTPPRISPVKISGITSHGATITWETNEDGYSLVEYDQDEQYKDSVLKGSRKIFVQSHVVQLTNLDPNTKYHYVASSADSSGNLAQSDDLTFTTLPAGSTPPEEKATLKQRTAADIQQLVKIGTSEEEVKQIVSGSFLPLQITSAGPKLSDITNSSVRVSWITDKKANSVIRFRVRGEDSEKEVGSFSELETQHSVALTSLDAGVSYEYQVQSSDILGNTSKTDWYSLTTNIFPSIYDVIVSGVNLSSATIEWKTSVPASDGLEYGTSINYGSSAEGKRNEKAVMHITKLNNLLSGRTYHYRIKGLDSNGNTLSSDDYTLTTYALPQVEEYKIASIKERDVILQWITNVETDSVVKYTDIVTGEIKSQGEDALTKTHDFNLKGLDPGKDYILQIQGRDVYGNQAISDQFDIRTSADITPPEFGHVSIETAVSSGKNSQVRTIISYTTSEPATAEIFYKQGADDGAYSASIPSDGNLTNNHIIVITDFKPATVYKFKLEAKDASGNIQDSRDFTVLVPAEKKSIIQMIAQNLENTFGWLKRIGG